MANLMIGTQEVQKIMHGTEELTTLAIGEWSFPVGGDDYASKPFTIEALGNGDVVVKRGGMAAQRTFVYKKNDEEPVTVTVKYNVLTIPVVSGDVISFAVSTAQNGTADSDSAYVSFKDGTVDYKVYGNILSLSYPVFEEETQLPSNYCNRGLFENNTHLVDAENLVFPDHTTEGCYKNMFAGCTGLLKAPKKLPAQTAVRYCYYQMFQGCTALVKGSDILAKDAGYYSCSRMYLDCTSFTTQKAMPTSFTGVNACESMFQGCTALETAPALPATDLYDSCYYGMFKGCTSLTTAPELPATTLAGGCYAQMFIGCSGLVLPPDLPATTLVSNCYMNMFENCTSLIRSPYLEADTLVNGCYVSMFRGCSSLDSVYCLATSLGSGNTNWWLDGVAASGTFTKAAGVSWARSVDGIPTDWNVDEI